MNSAGPATSSNRSNPEWRLRTGFGNIKGWPSPGPIREIIGKIIEDDRLPHDSGAILGAGGTAAAFKGDEIVFVGVAPVEKAKSFVNKIFRKMDGIE